MSLHSIFAHDLKIGVQTKVCRTSFALLVVVLYGVKESKMSNCSFCKKMDKLLKSVPWYSGTCNIGLLDNDECIAVLAPEQYTVGHTLVILREHRDDIADKSIQDEELIAFSKAIQIVAKKLMEKAQNENNQYPEKIYVCTLSDEIGRAHV